MAVTRIYCSLCDATMTQQLLPYMSTLRKTVLSAFVCLRSGALEGHKKKTFSKDKNSKKLGFKTEGSNKKLKLHARAHMPNYGQITELRNTHLRLGFVLSIYFHLRLLVKLFSTCCFNSILLPMAHAKLFFATLTTLFYILKPVQSDRILGQVPCLRHA